MLGEALRRSEANRIASRDREPFLEFVSEQTFLGNGDKLNEYLIGVEVYDRGPDFNSQRTHCASAGPRNPASAEKVLRGGGGKDSLIRVELPTGAYVPVFGRRAMEEADGVELPTEPATSLSHRRGWLHLALTLTLAAACLVLAFLLVARGGRSGKAAQSVPVVTALPEGLEWFWHPFLPPAEPPLIVIPNHPCCGQRMTGTAPKRWLAATRYPRQTCRSSAIRSIFGS